ncbi:MAG: hypothetical protein D6685_01880 [Bacteroidetes bacterium]|nr:MAG: hypothetical protein D6685_01880 [Bacteroidota bacterium]
MFMALCIPLLSLMLAVGPTLSSSAPDVPEPLQPHRLHDTAIRLDGSLDEAPWRTLPPIEAFYQQVPHEGAPPSERTAMWIAYDADALYLAARVWESDPQRITARTLERDSYTPDQDGIALILDTFDDDQTAVGFIVSPAGVRTDIAIANDAEGGGREPWNTDWNTFWDAATRIDAQGWTAEIRIPFSSLRFVPAPDGSVEMGLILWRYLARTAEYDVYPAIPNDWSYSAYKPSQALPVRFTGIAAARPLYVKPYALGGVERQPHLTPDGRAYTADREAVHELGLDLKYSLTSNLTLDVTANTDFAQVESDDQQVNLTRFSLFFPEKRDFFQERADLFEYNLPGGPQRLFQSRRIGIAEGQPIPILGGARLTGRMGAWEIGLLNMQTGRAMVDSLHRPSENFGVLRLKHDLPGLGAYVGGLVTSRTDFDGTYNLVLAGDADLDLGHSFFHQIKLGYSASPEAVASQSGLLSLLLRRRIRRGLGGGVSFTHLGAGFDPAVGFVLRTGIHRYGHRLDYTWFPEAGILQSQTLTNRLEFVWSGPDWASLWHPQGWALETNTVRLGWEGVTRAGGRTALTLALNREFLAEAFTIGDDAVTIPAGAYRFYDVATEWTTAQGRPLRLEAEGQAGGYFGGTRVSALLAPVWTLSAHLALGIDYGYNHVDAAGDTFTAHVARIRIRSALNRSLTASLFLQVNSSTSQASTNLRVRYNPREGNDLYLVYNEGMNLDRDPLDPHAPGLPLSQSRTLLLKYTYTFLL